MTARPRPPRRPALIAGRMFAQRMFAGTMFVGTMFVGTCASIAPAHAQIAPAATIEIGTDEARRGLSWTGGRAAASAEVQLSAGPVDGAARIVTLRNSARHDGADAVIDLSAATGWDLGAVRLRAEAASHLFAGARGGMDYHEIGASAGYGIGPLYATIGTMIAPSQAAIGGSNVYVYAAANAGIPGTPFTVLTRLGRASGSVDDPDRARRLRPDGTYMDWRIGVERRRDALTLGLDYIGTDIDQRVPQGRFADLDHSGDRLVGRVQIAF